MTDFNGHVGKMIEKYRKIKCIKQSQLAELIGMSRTQMLNIESGKHATTCERLYIIACILGVQVSDLFPDTKEMNFEIVTETIEVKKIKMIKKAILKP